MDGRATKWIALLVLAAAGAWAWWRYSPETLPDFVRPARELPPSAGATVVAEWNATGDPNPPLFKWKDAKGQWHVTDKPPASGAYEKVVVDPDTNVLPALIPEASPTPEGN